MKDFKNYIEKILDYELFKVNNFDLTVGKIVIILLIILFTKLLVKRIKKIIFNSDRFKEYDKGNLYSLTQIITYVIWLFAIIVILDTIGLHITAIITGSAALLVGAGFGLKQTFNDFFSGIILLLEGVTRVGDIIEVDGEVLKIKKIGLRTSEAINRDNIVVIVPNSKITTDKVINWTHHSKVIRFRISVGISYGSDVDLALKLLIDIANNHPNTIQKKQTDARFKDFGDSTLNLELLFYSVNAFRIEKDKSEMRLEINKQFNKNGIEIAFPQLDVHLDYKDKKVE
jgi:small-conductance mechanosensitive channel